MFWWSPSPKGCSKRLVVTTHAYEQHWPLLKSVGITKRSLPSRECSGHDQETCPLWYPSYGFAAQWSPQHSGTQQLYISPVSMKPSLFLWAPIMGPMVASLQASRAGREKSGCFNILIRLGYFRSGISTQVSLNHYSLLPLGNLLSHLFFFHRNEQKWSIPNVTISAFSASWT